MPRLALLILLAVALTVHSDAIRFTQPCEGTEEVPACSLARRHMRLRSITYNGQVYPVPQKCNYEAMMNLPTPITLPLRPGWSVRSTWYLCELLFLDVTATSGTTVTKIDVNQHPMSLQNP